MTEDDTFHRLARPTYAELRQRMDVLWPDGDWSSNYYVSQWNQFLVNNHWKKSDFWVEYAAHQRRAHFEKF